MHRTNAVRRDPSTPLAAAEREAVLSLALAAEQADGTAPLSEQFLLEVSGPPGLRTGLTDRVTHDLRYAADGALTAYAQLRPGPGDEPPSAELVVAPGARRQGLGTELLGGLPANVRVWSHASGPAGVVASAFAAARGLVPVRSLHVMERSLTAGPPWPTAHLPEPYAVRRFEVGRDEDSWVAVNAAAFADHPEQGALTRVHLEQRMAQPWWDPDGLILVVPRDDPDRIAAFHWTKVDPPDGSTGEVYVVGVAPDRQGEGLGRAVTVLGLDHLRSLGLDDVILHVDEENVVAMHTYRGLGFTDRAVHRQFARQHLTRSAPVAPEKSAASWKRAASG